MLLRGARLRTPPAVRDIKKQETLPKAIGRKFCRENTRLNLPVFLEDEVAELVKKYADRRKVGAQTAPNRICVPANTSFNGFTAALTRQ